MNHLSKEIIGCAIEVHRHLGPGLLESAYEKCLVHELKTKNFHVEYQVPMPIVYKDIHLNHGYRMDIVVNKKIVIEIKAVDFFTDVHKAQLLTYLKLGGYPLGLLINFNVNMLKQGLKRIIHTPN